MMENQIATRNETQLAGVKSEINPFIEGSSVKAFEVIESLNKLSLVTPNDVATLEKAQTFLLSTYTDVPSHRTYIDKCVGVLTNSRFPTPDAKYWQCKKEAEVQFYELMREILSHKKAMISLKEIIYKREKAKEAIAKNDQNVDIFLAECDVEKFDIAISEINISIKKIEKEIKYRIAEIGDWLAISKEWEPEMKHSKDSYNEHNVEALYRFLDAQINDAKNKGDNKAYENFMDQKRTLESLLARKMNSIMKNTKATGP